MHKITLIQEPHCLPPGELNRHIVQLQLYIATNYPFHNHQTMDVCLEIFSSLESFYPDDHKALDSYYIHRTLEVLLPPMMLRFRCSRKA
jgi:hypothetical protein